MYKILLVEDDAGIAKEIADYASAWGLDVHIAKNFENIMAEFASVQPHLVLLDISLPYFDGYYWCSQMRNVSKIPIIFLSSASDNMNILMAMNMGADDFIAKPFDRNVLIAKLLHIAKLNGRICGAKRSHSVFEQPNCYQSV